MQDAIAVDDIDGNFIPGRGLTGRARGGLGEGVDPGNAVHANPTAALVWQCFDGDVSLDELVGELAGATSAKEETIRSDVMELTRNLASIGMLEGIASPAPFRGAGGRRQPSRPFGRPQGRGRRGAPDLRAAGPRRRHDELGLLPGPAGAPGQLEHHVRFLHPHRGELAALQGSLRDRGVSLVFLTRGFAEHNREVFADHGIDAAVLLTDGNDPFAGFGTPAAYFVDGDGKVASPFALGAFEVPVLAREAAGVEEAMAGAGQTAASYLPAAAAVCGGGPTDPVRATTNWAGTASYRFGDFHVGVRYNEEDTAQTLDRLFPEGRIADPQVPDNYGVALYTRGGRKRDLNLLVKGAQQLVRTRSRARVLRGLLNYLSADLASRDPALLQIRTAAVVRDGRATVLPFDSDLLAPRSPAPAQPVRGPARRRAVGADRSGDSRAPRARTDGRARRRCARRARPRRPVGARAAAAAPRPLPLGSWIIATNPDKEGPLSPGRGLVAAVPVLVVPDGDMEPAAQDLIALFGKVEPIGASPDSPASLVRLLQRAG